MKDVRRILRFEDCEPINGWNVWFEKQGVPPDYDVLVIYQLQEQPSYIRIKRFRSLNGLRGVLEKHLQSEKEGLDEFLEMINRRKGN